MDWAKITGVELSRPSAARVYDYALGGDHNFAVDRAMGDELHAIDPSSPFVAWANRAFLRRAVDYCLEQGIDQFLDLGAGIPTVGNVHEIAQSRRSDTRVVYVDSEPIAVAHTRRLLAGNDRAAIVSADLRDPQTVLCAAETQRLLDLSRPVGLLMVAVLHYVSEDTELTAVVDQYRHALAPGSHLVVSHTTAAGREQEAELVRRVFDKAGEPVTFRDHDQIRAVFDGFELLEPGVVWTASWRPDPGAPEQWPPERSGCWAGVAIKR